MTRSLQKIVLTELVWLVGIMLLSLGIEYLILELFDLHFVLRVKIQGFIGLMVIGYMIRMITRFIPSLEENALNKTKSNGQNSFD